MGDCSQILNDFVPAHADTRIFQGQDTRFFITFDGDFQRKLGVFDGRAPAGFKTEFIQGIRGIGYELAHENFSVGVQRVGDDIQKFLDFSFKLTMLLCCSHTISLFFRVMTDDSGTGYTIRPVIVADREYSKDMIHRERIRV